MKKLVLFLICVISLVSLISAFPTTHHLNIQVVNDSGYIEVGTYLFNFTINSNDDCTGVVYSNSTTLTTDARGIVNYYLEDVGDIDFSNDYYFCYYRDNVLKANRSLSSVPYANFAKNVSSTGISWDANADLGNYNLTSSGLTIFGNSYFNGTLMPMTSLAFDIGSGANRWRNIYATNLSIDNIDVSEDITLLGELTGPFGNFTELIAGGINVSGLDNQFLNLSGTNANQNVNISSYSLLAGGIILDDGTCLDFGNRATSICESGTGDIDIKSDGRIDIWTDTEISLRVDGDVNDYFHIETNDDIPTLRSYLSNMALTSDEGLIDMYGNVTIHTDLNVTGDINSIGINVTNSYFQNLTVYDTTTLRNFVFDGNADFNGGNVSGVDWTTSNYFSGDGHLLTNLSTSAIPDIWVNESGDTMTGNLIVDGFVNATGFNGTYYGDGSQLTGLLKLDQTTPQTIINGVPLLDETPNGGVDIKSFVNKEYVDLAVTSLGAAYYMYDEDDATGYKTCYLNPSGDAETYIEVADLNDDDYIGGWISAPNEAPPKLLKGVYDWLITAEKTTGIENLRVYWELVERKSDTSEVVIATSSNSNELDGKSTYLIPLQLTEDYIPDSGSRIVGKLYADVSGSGNAPTIRIYYQGETSSRWEIPANSEIFQNIFVPYTGAVQNVDLGEKNLTLDYLQGVTLNFTKAYIGDIVLELDNITAQYHCDDFFCYNLTFYNNTIWTSTYNETYSGLINNLSYLSTYNSTYAGYALNVSINYTKLTYDTYNTKWNGVNNTNINVLKINASSLNLNWGNISNVHLVNSTGMFISTKNSDSTFDSYAFQSKSGNPGYALWDTGFGSGWVMEASTTGSLNFKSSITDVGVGSLIFRIENDGTVTVNRGPSGAANSNLLLIGHAGPFTDRRGAGIQMGGGVDVEGYIWTKDGSDKLYWTADGQVNELTDPKSWWKTDGSVSFAEGNFTVATDGQVLIGGGNIILDNNGTILAKEYADLTPAYPYTNTEALDYIKRVSSISVRNNLELNHSSLSPFTRKRVPVWDYVVVQKLVEGTWQECDDNGKNCINKSDSVMTNFTELQIVGYQDARDIGASVSELYAGINGLIEENNRMKSCASSSNDFIEYKICIAGVEVG